MFRLPMRGQFLHAIPKHHEGMVMKQCRPRFKKDQFMRFSSQESNASAANSAKNTWVEVEGPTGSNLKYWWNSATNQTTPLGAPRPPEGSFFRPSFGQCGYGGYGGGNGGGHYHGYDGHYWHHHPYGYPYGHGRRFCFGGFFKVGAAVLLTAFVARCVFYKDCDWRQHHSHRCHHFDDNQCPRCKKTIEDKSDSSSAPSTPPATST